MTTERFETVIIGGGQAGLAAGYHLTKQGRSFVILDANERIGDSWRNRWDSLRLFTPARFCKLPGMKLPVRQASFPTKDEMGDYLEAYAARFGMPTRTQVHVDALTTDGHRFVVTAGRRAFEADNIVVATGAHRVPKVPAFARDLASHITQLHSSAYRSPAQLADGDVLVVGLGNSGSEIGLELARSRRTYVAGSPSAQLPFRHSEGGARIVFPVIRFIGHHVLCLKTPIGRKVQPKFVAHAAPLIRVKTSDLDAAGVERTPRVAGTQDGLPVLEDGRVLDVTNVVWCTGFSPTFPWIDLPAFDDDGRPVHTRGVATVPGLYFMGLPFQYAASSEAIPGMGRDAEHVAKHIAKRSTGRGALALSMSA